MKTQQFTWFLFHIQNLTSKAEDILQLINYSIKQITSYNLNILTNVTDHYRLLIFTKKYTIAHNKQRLKRTKEELKKDLNKGQRIEKKTFKKKISNSSNFTKVYIFTRYIANKNDYFILSQQMKTHNYNILNLVFKLECNPQPRE